MVVIRFLFFYIILLCINLGCSWTKSYDFDRVFYKKYDQKKIATFSDFLDTGFFITQSKQDTEFYTTIILFPDGIVNFDTHKRDSNLYRLHLSKLISNNIYLKQGNWGYYYFEGNKLLITITTQPGGMSNYSTRFTFKILNNNELKLIETLDSNGENNTLLTNKKFNKLLFVKIANYPMNDCWLKNKGWFWADKKAYQAYKKKLKDLQ
jgi:hypothetical protein